MTTLYYWDIRGRAEVARLLLSAANVPFTVEQPVDFKTDKKHYPFGQCPRLADGTVDICQSNTINRYLARKYGFEGKTEQDKVVADMATEAVESLRCKYVPLIYREQLSDAGKAAFIETHINKANANSRNDGAHVSYLNWFVENGKEGFITGSGLTVGDVAIWEMTDLLMRIFKNEISSEYPALAAFYEDLPKKVPGIGAYLSSPQRPAKPNNSVHG